MCGRRAAKQFEPPEAARPPGQQPGGFCQLVRGVSQRRSIGMEYNFGGDGQR